jgi:hypothetical protein
VARKRVASKLVLAGVAYDECEERSGLGCLHWHVLAAYGDTPLMHDDRCIAALRCAGIAYSYGMMRSFFLTFVPFLSSEYFPFLSCHVLQRTFKIYLQRTYSKHKLAAHASHKARQGRA